MYYKSEIFYNMNRIINYLFLTLVSILLLTSCSEEANVKPKPIRIERTYSVRLSNAIGSDYYYCDTIIKIGSNEYLLKNREDSIYFIKIVLSNNVLLRISNLNLEKKYNE